MQNTRQLVDVPLIIDGRQLTASSKFDVVSPETGQPCWTASSATTEDALKAVEAASTAYVLWSRTKPIARRDILLKAAELIESRLDEHATFMRTEMGSDVGTSQHFVVPLAIRMLRDIASRIAAVCGNVPVVEGEGQSAIVLKEPMGVVLSIGPWNAPAVFAIRGAASALATGNTVVLKSSEHSPRSYWAIAQAFLDAGLPAGCLNVLSCRRDDAAAIVNAMIEHSAVKKINFTGSAAIGRKVAKACGGNLKPCLMELGGKNSAIICTDANIKMAVQSVLAGSFIGSGQICMSTDRILVHSAIAPQFLAELKAAFSANANSSQPSPTLVSSASKARVQSVVSEALSSGAQPVYGDASSESSKGTGIRMTPLILDNVNEETALWQDENFASLAAFKIVKDDEEAINATNKTGYGLSASVFTEDLRKGFAIAKRLETGAVHINSMTVHDEPALPHGGVKDSGWGRFNTNCGLEEFLVTKSVTWMD